MRAAAHGLTSGDVTGAFAGHEICPGDEWLHSAERTHTGQSCHPTAEDRSGG
jgi:hypothetical protein